MTTFEQWRALMPARSEQQTKDDEGLTSGAVLWQRTYGAVETQVIIPVSWPGVVKPEDVPGDIEGRTRTQIGRWVLDDTGLVCLGQSWDLDASRFDECDWLAHVMGHGWCYDPTDFFDAVQEARRAFCAHRGEAWIDAAVWQEVQTVLSRGSIPVYPSSVVGGKHVYLPNRMSPHQRDAFATFLVEQSIFAS